MPQHETPGDMLSSMFDFYGQNIPIWAHQAQQMRPPIQYNPFLMGLMGAQQMMQKVPEMGAPQPYVPDPSKPAGINFLGGLGSSAAQAIHGFGEDVIKPATDFLFTPEGTVAGRSMATPEAMVPTTMPSLPPPSAGNSGFTLDLGDNSPLPQLGMGAAPDFSEAEKWLGQTAPTASDPAAMREMMISNWLAGLAGGAASVNAGEEGLSAVLASAGAGGASGLAESKEQQFALGREDQALQREYAGNRAGFAADKASMMADYSAGAAEAKYQNEMAAYEAGQAKVVSSTKDGLTVQRGNSIQFIPTSSNTQAFEDLKTAVTALGGDHAAVQPMIYEQLFSSSADLETVQQQIIKDIVANGAGPTVFPETYADAVAHAEENLPAGVIGEDSISIINNYVANLLLEDVLETGDFSWLEVAAMMGNYGALKLMQNRQPTPIGNAFQNFSAPSAPSSTGPSFPSSFSPRGFQ